ncbi:hypothetical protein ACQKTA_05085 [Enterococcus sp. 22-H-5-01]|uniref:hypothetical protein n=1 Tax=Enterococcus sp. 22-H-5-01 TaxID=3418555 RepID=UPI003D048F7D
MKDKPQMIRASIDMRFLNQYIKMLVPAIQRKFNVEPGIEGPLFSDKNSIDEMYILFLSTDEQAQDIFNFINSKWQFESIPVLVS